MKVYICSHDTNFEKDKKYYLEKLSIEIQSKTTFGVNIIHINTDILNTPYNADINTDFIMYHEEIKGNPFNFKNVIRFLCNIPSSEVYESFNNTDIIFFKNINILKNVFQTANVYHPDIIDYYNDDLYRNNVIFNIDDHLEESMKNFKDIIMKRVNFEEVRFTEPIFNLFNKNGLQHNIIKAKITCNALSIETNFIMNSFNFDYENIFDLNYGSINVGPRLEIDKNGFVSLIIGVSDNNFDGYRLNNIAIKPNEKVSLKIAISNNNISYNFNNYIGSYITNKKVFNVNNISICGGFNNERNLKNGTLFNFKLYNYNIPILQELDHYLPNMDTWYLNYPRKILNCFYKYESLSIVNKEIFDNITLRFIFDINKDGTYEIINMSNLVLYREKNQLILRLYHKTYRIAYNLDLNKSYNIIISIDLKNELGVVVINNHTNTFKLEHLFQTIEIHNIYINNFLQNLSISNYNMNTYLTFDTCNIDAIRNFYNTFGFLKINNLFISVNENMIKAYSYNVLKYVKNKITDYVPRAMEKLTFFVNIILNKKIHMILEKVFNTNYSYTGSDSKIYSSDTNWHCDRKTKNHYLKCCFYLNKLNETTGCLRVLPGSQITEKYNNIISKKAIPLFLGPGGFEPSFFGENTNNIPSYSINNDYGDFVIFNLGLYHAAFGNHVNKKMICMNFCENYSDNNDPEKLEAINSDFGIIGNLCKNLDLSKKIMPIYDTFYNYVKHDDLIYAKYFKAHIENDNILDKYIRIMLNPSMDQSELLNFIQNNKNGNIKKTNVDILINNTYI
jgi:ectoine hydroxylase-related dioxygenase (phytanoyl-CoA dioxygenase family)